MAASAKVPAFNDDLLIKADGELDHANIAMFAQAHAADRAKRYGDEATASDVAEFVDKYTCRAEILRNRRRRELGLPDDTIYTTITPFGRQIEGVRYSQF